MKRGLATAVALLLLLLVAPRAQAANDALKKAQDTFVYGDYAEASRLTKLLLDGNQLSTSGDLIEAYRIAGLSNFYLNHTDAARSAFIGLLTQDPDYALDPFLFPPAAVAFFDGGKRDNGGPLELIRAERRAQAERERLADEARKHLLEDQLRRQLEPDRPVLVERVEKRTFALNFVPFGIGEFQEDRTLVGGLLGGTQLAALATAAISFGYIESLRNDFGTYNPDKFPVANQVAVAKWIGLGVFGAAYAGAVVDSLTHYEGSVSRIEALPQPPQRTTPAPPSPSAPAPAAPPPERASPPPARPATSSMLLVPWATPTGGGVALSLRF